MVLLLLKFHFLSAVSYFLKHYSIPPAPKGVMTQRRDASKACKNGVTSVQVEHSGKTACFKRCEMFVSRNGALNTHQYGTVNQKRIKNKKIKKAMKNDQIVKYVRKQNLKTFCMKLVFVSKKKCLLDHFLESTAKGSTAVVFCFWQAL